jgi:sodium/bile acid cotransporter 7
MGVPLSTTIFAGMDPVLRSKIQIPIVIFQGLQIACGGALIPLFRKWVATEEARMVGNGGPGVDVEMAVEGHEVLDGRQSVDTKAK